MLNVEKLIQQKNQIINFTIGEPDPPISNSVSETEDSTAEARKKVEELLRELRNGHHPHDDSPQMTTDQLLDGLCYKDFPALRRAHAKLSIKSKDKKKNRYLLSKSHYHHGGNFKPLPGSGAFIHLA